MQKFPYKAARKMTLEDSIVKTMPHSNSILRGKNNAEVSRKSCHARILSTHNHKRPRILRTTNKKREFSLACKPWS